MIPNWLRLSVGTLTRLPVPAPTDIDTKVARSAMLAAPAVGLALGLVTGLPLLIADISVSVAALCSILSVTAAVWATRALHWDGLADTVDALGSGKPASQALEIARRSDLGPMGAVALILVAALEIAGVTAAADFGWAYWLWVFGCVVGRAGLVLACSADVPPARSDGLGVVVARSVPSWWAVAMVVVVASIGVIAAGWGLLWLSSGVIGLAAGALVIRSARRRLGGITGDVLGAVVEVTTVGTIVAGALLMLVLP